MKEISSSLMQSSAKINDLHISQWFAVCLVLLSGAARPEVYPGYFFFTCKRVLNHKFVKIQKLPTVISESQKFSKHHSLKNWHGDTNINNRSLDRSRSNVACD
jgi:hypothetical protein